MKPRSPRILTATRQDTNSLIAGGYSKNLRSLLGPCIESGNQTESIADRVVEANPCRRTTAVEGALRRLLSSKDLVSKGRVAIFPQSKASKPIVILSNTGTDQRHDLSTRICQNEVACWINGPNTN